MTSNEALAGWVAEVASLTQPERIHWCDGSEAEYRALVAGMLADGTLHELDQAAAPGCYLHRSHPSDVARTEHLTFVCTRRREDAGPNNNWLAPEEARARMRALYDGAMRGRTLYVVPYCMGPLDSPYARCGVELSDSPYVAASMRRMTRMGAGALARIEREGTFVRGLHSVGDLDPERRFIMHFPETLEIQSVGSGYGGNALLGKKCHALRIASWQAREEGWLAEHMLLMGLEDPSGRVHYIGAAFPSACGKTNMAMLIPPARFAGWKVHTLGDDIAWLHPGPDGRLWAINPEAGFFGVAPGTGPQTNPRAVEMVRRDTIFTNVAMTADRRPWWEGLSDEVPALDWRGAPYRPGSGPAAHPNARFTVSARQCPSWSPAADAPQGVPLSAIVFGGRRADLMPLVLEARDWTHGVLLGAGMASETTAAATGKVGVVRRDPMAMKPFCGYEFGRYWAHWLEVGSRLRHPPGIYHVNWFRRDPDGGFMWPGFGENLRVLQWILGRCARSAAALETPVGNLPAPGALDVAGLDLPPAVLAALTTLDAHAMGHELAEVEQYLRGFATPRPLLDELARARAALRAQPPRAAAR
jgi:phosphoenolpyruvate carboxykinase (GTP)